MSPPRDQATVFDEVAAVYQRVRPDYPEAVVDEVLSYAALGPGERLLEIGAGTGKATLGFAGRGHPILCIEPGASMAAALRETCAGHADVSVAETRLEDWPVEPEAFGLVYAAQSFHWVDAVEGPDRCARALRPGGALAVFGHRPQRGEAAVHRAIEACYAEHAEALSRGVAPKRRFLEELSAHPALAPVEYRAHAFERDYDAATYRDLLRTQSDHRLLAPEALERLLDAVGEAVERHGGVVRVGYRTDILLTRRKRTGSAPAS